MATSAAPTHAGQRQAPGEDGVAVSDLLLAVAAELDRTRSLGRRLERAVCAVAVQAQTDYEIVRELQQLDLLIQQIAALHDFLVGVVALSDVKVVMRPQDVAAALDRVTLSDLRSRLVGEPGEDPAAHANAMELL